MSTQGQDENGPSNGHARARLGAVKTPRVARPRRRRAGGLDRTCVEHRTASVDAPPGPWHEGMRGCSGAPCILVTMGQESRVYHAFVTSAPCQLDAPSRMTLHVSTFGDVAGFAADDVALDGASARGAGRIVLVDTLELEWQPGVGARETIRWQRPTEHRYVCRRCSAGYGSGSRHAHEREERGASRFASSAAGRGLWEHSAISGTCGPRQVGGGERTGRTGSWGDAV
jgi:hypothetical protein